MDAQEFTTKLEAAFNDGLPVVEKVNDLLTALNNETEKDYDLLYQLCRVHYKVAKSEDADSTVSTPVKDRQFWFKSVDWLVDHLYWIETANETDDRFDEFSNGLILWWFKWVMGSIDENPDISLAEIEEFNAKMEEYYTEIFDLGKRSGYKIRVMQAIKMGNSESLELNLYNWLEAAEHNFDDCWACQLDDIVRSYCFLKRYDKALIWAEEIIDGTSNCGEVPHLTNGLIAEAYFHTGQRDKAQETLKKGYELINKKPSMITPLVDFMRVYREMDMQEDAINVYHDNESLIESCESLFQQMLFHIEASRLPVDKQEDHKQRARELAQRFDVRNGNTFFTEQLSEY